MFAHTHPAPEAGQQHVWSHIVIVLYYRLQTRWQLDLRVEELLSSGDKYHLNITVQSLGVRKTKLTDGKDNK